MHNPIEDKLDRLWSKKIHLIWNEKCAMCGCAYNLSPHHGIVKRKYKSTRWDIRNGFLLCINHHGLAEQNPDFFKAWVIKRIGEKLFDIIRLQGQVHFHGDYDFWLKHLGGE